jgi:hypothetical protein
MPTITATVTAHAQKGTSMQHKPPVTGICQFRRSLPPQALADDRQDRRSADRGGPELVMTILPRGILPSTCERRSEATTF